MALENVFGDLALDATLQTILVELAQKLESGGVVALDGATVSAMVDSGEKEYIPVVASATSPGDTVLHTPAPGKRIKVRWLYAINDPVATSSTRIKIKLGTKEIYRVWALSKRQVDIGDVDAPLVINLSAPGDVCVTGRIEEI